MNQDPDIAFGAQIKSPGSTSAWTHYKGHGQTLQKTIQMQPKTCMLFHANDREPYSSLTGNSIMNPVMTGYYEAPEDTLFVLPMSSLIGKSGVTAMAERILKLGKKNKQQYYISKG